MARPLKISENFINAVKKIINDITAIAFTDEDFLFEVNWELKPKDQISIDTFYRYQKKEEESDILKEFCNLLKKARHKAKIELIKEVRAGPQNWQSRSWILERKYPEYNLKQISEHKFDIQPITIKINLAIEKPKETKPKINITEAQVLETQIN